MQILVTGGCGYLGSRLVPQLLVNGHRVTVLDNMMYGVPSLAECCDKYNFNFVSGDVRNVALLESLLAEVDVCIPLAAIVGAPACALAPGPAWDINYSHVAVIARYSTKLKVIFPTTNSGYGIGGELICTEGSPLKPISEYGRSKVAAEQGVLGHGGISLRLATVFGLSPRMRFDLMVNDFVRRALRDKAIVLFQGGFRRNFVHIKDVVYAFEYCIYHYDKMKGKAYNFGNDDLNMNKRQLCQEIKKHIPDLAWFESETGEDPDKRDYIVSSQRARDAGLVANRSLEDGINEIIRGYPMFSKEPHGNA